MRTPGSCAQGRVKAARHLLLARVREDRVLEGVASVDPLHSVQWF